MPPSELRCRHDRLPKHRPARVRLDRVLRVRRPHLREQAQHAQRAATVSRLGVSRAPHTLGQSEAVRCLRVVLRNKTPPLAQLLRAAVPGSVRTIEPKERKERDSVFFPLYMSMYLR